MQKQQAKKSIAKRFLRVIALLLILGLGVFFLAKNGNAEWQELTKHSFQLNFWFLALAFAGFLLQELSYGFIWRSVLARLGYHLDFRPCLRIYLASEFVRYIPGNVWHVLTRVLWVGKYGVPRSVAFASMVIELTTKLIAGALVFAASLIFWGNLRAFDQLLSGDLAFAGLHLPIQSLVIGLGLAGVLVSLLVLHPRVLNYLLGRALRLLKRDPVVLPLRYRDVLLITLAWSGSWVVAGGGLFCVVTSIVAICSNLLSSHLYWDLCIGLGYRVS